MDSVRLPHTLLHGYESSKIGMAHASEILAQIAHLGLRYCEVPVTITYTSYSLQKGQKFFDSINVLWDMLMEKMR